MQVQIPIFNLEPQLGSQSVIELVLQLFLLVEVMVDLFPPILLREDLLEHQLSNEK